MKSNKSFWEQKDIDTWRRSYESLNFFCLLIVLLNFIEALFNNEKFGMILNCLFAVVPLIVLWSYQQWKKERQKIKN